MNPFLLAPEFIETDTRKDRVAGTVTYDSLYNRHILLAPESTVKDKTVLDLGCAVGATGYWVLYNGAKSYTGIDSQKSFVEKAKNNLSGYNAEIILSDIEDFLNSTDKKWDIIICAGFLFSFLDFTSILKKVTSLANDYVTIDTNSINNTLNSVPQAEIRMTKISNERKTDNVGYGISINYAMLKIYMESYGFESCGEPQYLENINMYGETGIRYISRYVNTGIKIETLVDSFRNNGKEIPWIKL